jgi:HEAT repeat protein
MTRLAHPYFETFQARDRERAVDAICDYLRDCDKFRRVLAKVRILEPGPAPMGYRDDALAPSQSLMCVGGAGPGSG